MHLKYWPKFNDSLLIQHADDQVEDGTAPATTIHEDEAYNDHIIGDAIESYQGAKTVEILGDITRAEVPCEQRKIVTFAAREALYHLIFRFRAVAGSATYIDVHQYIRVVYHTTHGDVGGP